MNRDFQNIKGFIFDLDGTLVTSNINFPKLQALIGCEQGGDVLAFLDRQSDPHEKARLLNIIEQTELEDARSSQVIDGVNEFLAELHQNEVPTAIVTRNFRTAANIKLERAQLPIDLVVTRADAPPKPDPTALLQISQRWRLKPTAIAYVGDYHFDVDAALNANMLACLFLNNRNSRPEYAERAHYVFSDYSEIRDALRPHLPFTTPCPPTTWK